MKRRKLENFEFIGREDLEDQSSAEHSEVMLDLDIIKPFVTDKKEAYFNLCGSLLESLGIMFDQEAEDSYVYVDEQQLCGDFLHISHEFSGTAGLNPSTLLPQSQAIDLFGWRKDDEMVICLLDYYFDNSNRVNDFKIFMLSVTDSNIDPRLRYLGDRISLQKEMYLEDIDSGVMCPYPEFNDELYCWTLKGMNSFLTDESYMLEFSTELMQDMTTFSQYLLSLFNEYTQETIAEAKQTEQSFMRSSANNN